MLLSVRAGWLRAQGLDGLCRRIDDIANDDREPAELRRQTLRDLDQALRREDHGVPCVRIAIRLRDAHGMRLA